MGSVSLTLAAVTGGLSVLNPCGFPLLPAFLSFYTGTDDVKLPSAPSRAAQGLQVGLLVTAGFLGVFTLIGLPITLGANAVSRAVPWVGLSIGGILVAVGLASLSGRTIRLSVGRRGGNGNRRTRGAVMAFGAGYGLASLGCTLPLFLTLVAASMSADGTFSSLLTFGAYGAGMGTVVMALALAAAFARQGLARILRRFLPWLSRAAGVMLVVAGVYLSYYWWRIRYGPTSTLSSDPIVGRVSRSSAELQQWAHHRGGLLLAGAAIVVGAGILATWHRHRTTPPNPI